MFGHFVCSFGFTAEGLHSRKQMKSGGTYDKSFSSETTTQGYVSFVFLFLRCAIVAYIIRWQHTFYRSAYVLMNYAFLLTNF